MSGDRWRWFNLVCVCANPAHMMVLVWRGRGAHELCRFCSNIWSWAHEPIRKSLIRFSLCAENRCEASQSKGRTNKKWYGFRKAEFLQFGAAVSPCLSFASLLIFFWNNLSSQENVTLPCRLWLHPNLPPTVSLSLSLSLSSHFIIDIESFLPPLLFTAYHVPFPSSPPLLCSPASPSPPLRD